MAKRIRVGVIFGGKSGEHEVSLNSAKSVMKAIDTTKFELVPIAINKAGHWLTGPDSLQIMDNPPTALIEAVTRNGSQEIQSIGEATTDSSSATSGSIQSTSNEKGSYPSPNTVAQHVDVIFPVLHGSYGEDGTIQGMLEMLDLPYVGAGVLSSAVGMDKVFMKRCFAAFDLPQVQYTSYTRKMWEKDPDFVLTDVEQKIGYPCFVKPANLGSSVGITKAKDGTGLKTAMNLAAAYDLKVVVEEGIDAREIEVAVLGNDDPQVSVPGEIAPCNEFYDYKAKYVDGDSVLTIPAPLTREQTQQVRDLAIAAFQAVDGSGLARVDFFIERGTGRVVLNEINTMPGFTQISMYPKLWEASGVTYPELIERLIQLALERYEEKRKTRTDFDPVN